MPLICIMHTSWETMASMRTAESRMERGYLAIGQIDRWGKWAESVRVGLGHETDGILGRRNRRTYSRRTARQPDAGRVAHGKRRDSGQIAEEGWTLDSERDVSELAVRTVDGWQYGLAVRTVL